MIEKHLDIPTADGAMNSFVVYPEEGGPHPVVLFYMDAPGKREELHDMARRLASVGYYVVLPNLYYRRSRDFWLQERTEPAMAVMFEHMAALTNAMTVSDTQALLKFVDAQPEANAKRIGAVGYCMSGPFVVAAAAAYPDRIHAIASFHPARMVTDAPDSPHLVMPTVQCESYHGCAEIDKWCPPADVEQMRAAMAKTKAPGRLEMYMGVEHGFTFPLRKGIYNQPAAERHWERLLSLFRRNLGPGMNAAALLIAASAAVLLVLGTMHLIFTFHGPKFDPRDAALKLRMQEVSPVISKDTTMWKAWISFNATHSLGAMLFGLVYGYLALWHAVFLFDAWFLLAVGLALLVSIVAIGRAYWFRIPLRGSLIATVLYCLGLILQFS